MSQLRVNFSHSCSMELILSVLLVENKNPPWPKCKGHGGLLGLVALLIELKVAVDGFLRRVHFE